MIDYPGKGFNMPVESLNCDAIAKATRKKPTEADLARGKQRTREGLEDEWDRIADLIDFHSLRAGYYKDDVAEIDRKISAIMEAIKELEPLAPSRGSIRLRIEEHRERIASLQEWELRVAISERDKHAKLLAVNMKLKAEFPIAELKAYQREQSILAKAGL